MRSKVLLITFAVGLVGVGAWFPSIATADTKIAVVATNSILADLVRNVGGDMIELHVLVGPNADVHTFEPSPQDNIVLAKAKIIFEIGLHLEPWLNDLYTASSSQAQRYCVTTGMADLIRIHDNEVDPHVWHDPWKVVDMVKMVRDGLVKADPGHSDIYETNANAYLNQLAWLMNSIQTKILEVPVERRKLVTSHDTFGYFARRFGFQIVGAAIDSATTEAADPSALKIAQLVEQVKMAKVPAVFMENVSNPKLIDAVAREAGVKVAPKLYSDALGEAGSPGEDYIHMMQHNVEVIVEALRQ